MICFPNAKINLGLHITSRRQDGYHNLESIFYPIGLKDALEIVPFNPELSYTGDGHREATATEQPRLMHKQGRSPLFKFHQTGRMIEGDEEDNLVIRALRLIGAEHPIPAIAIHLLKKIPSGAGLGGGSSNAASMLHLLNDNFNLGYTLQELTHLAVRLGADVPFFIHNKPAYATGIGDQLEPLELDLSDLFFIVVKPDVMISTKEAYARITPRQPELSLREIVKKPVTEWRELMKNDFEPALFKKYPQICTLKQQLYERGALYASMSGSGSSVYGFFQHEPEMKGIYSDHFVWTNKLTADR